jgi:hypothetical protein
MTRRSQSRDRDSTRVWHRRHQRTRRSLIHAVAPVTSTDLRQASSPCLSGSQRAAVDRRPRLVTDRLQSQYDSAHRGSAVGRTSFRFARHAFGRSQPEAGRSARSSRSGGWRQALGPSRRGSTRGKATNRATAGRGRKGRPPDDTAGGSPHRAGRSRQAAVAVRPPPVAGLLAVPNRSDIHDHEHSWRTVVARRDQSARSKRSRFITLFHAAAKSLTNFFCPSALA